MQFMFGRTRVQILAHAARCGDSSHSDNDDDKRTSYCIPCEEPREEIYRTKQNNLFILKNLHGHSQCFLKGFRRGFSLESNPAYKLWVKAEGHLHGLGCLKPLTS
jgi:hypothetical protein